MAKTTITVTAKFGSKFQRSFAEKSLMTYLRSWKSFLDDQHKKNEVKIEVDGINIIHLDWFNL